MSALTFDKNELGNLEYSLQREVLSTDRRGGYMSTTIVCCNTRRYHGLMVAPIGRGDQTCVLLSSLDETIVQHDQSFNLAIHRFRGVYEPRGHKYITDFAYTPTPTITYRVGGVILRKELLWIHKRTQLMIRYTLLDSPADIRLRLRPFFAYREKEALTHANMEANGRSYPVQGGVKNRLYEGYPWLYLQTNRPDAEFVAAPDWYYGFEYPQELARGYDGYEDLLTTGYFELPLSKGQSVIFSASVEEMASSAEIGALFDRALARRTHKIDFHSLLRHSARQFVIRRPDGRTEVMAGYPWLTAQIAREAFMSLPGITLEQDHKEDCIDVLDSVCRTLRDGDFAGSASAAQEADAPLWFFYTLQELESEIGSREIWRRYGEAMKSILAAYRRGIGGRVALHGNGLVWASDEHVALTWMNSYADGRPVTPRNGYQVEINALWYNAVSYALSLAEEAGEDQGVVSGKILASGRGIPGRFRKRRRDQPLHPPQHGRRLRPELHDARRGAAHLRAAHRPPIPAYPEGAAFALAAESALQRLLRRRRPDALPRRDERYGVGMAAALLRQGPLCAHRRRLHTRSRAVPRRLRRGHPVPRHRFDLEDVRRRPALRP